jgi:hypothetical protein
MGLNESAMGLLGRLHQGHKAKQAAGVVCSWFEFVAQSPVAINTKVRFLSFCSLLQLFALTPYGDQTNYRVVDPIQNDDYSGQLRYLRLLLGRNFRPISTAALAALTEIPHVAVRGVEAGRRELNDQDRFLIRTRIGGYWDPQLRQWLAIWQEKKGVPLPFSRQTYERYSEGLISSFSLAVPNIKRIADALRILSGNLEPKDVAMALLTVHQSILNFAREKNVDPDLIERLDDLHPDLKFMIVKQPGRDKALADLEESEAETPSNSANH